MNRCDQRRGIFGRCRLEMLHPGDHDDGKGTWPRTGIDLDIYLEAMAIVERERQQREYRQRLLHEDDEKRRRR
jgi:hypothetical protein